MPNPLSDSLVPTIHKEQSEAVANDFLRRYYPKALKTPMVLKKLAKKMGLSMDVRNITRDLSIFGQVYFHDAATQSLTNPILIFLIKDSSYQWRGRFFTFQNFTEITKKNEPSPPYGKIFCWCVI